MFGGEKINASEKRAVLRVALRAPKGQSILADGDNVVPGVHAVLDRMADFSNRTRTSLISIVSAASFKMAPRSAGSANRVRLLAELMPQMIASSQAIFPHRQRQAKYRAVGFVTCSP
jgi:Phosphoglucose isomerase